jgi:hypothetical protein
MYSDHHWEAGGRAKTRPIQFTACMVAMLLFMAKKVPYKLQNCQRCMLVKKKKDKVVPLRSTEGHLGDRRYSSYSFLTLVLEGGEWSASRPGCALPPGKEQPVPIV